jgi:predicted nucleotidyltransferase
MIPPKIEQQLKRFLEVLQSRWGQDLVSVVLFGSWARGDPKEESDIDLLLIREGFPRSRLDRHKEIFDAARAVSKEFASQISAIPLMPEEATAVRPFYLGILTSHVFLFDRDGFFQRILDRLAQRLRALGSERRLDRDGYEYWILKKDLRIGEAVEL